MTILLAPEVPSTAFGDGSHPTTRLCMKAVNVICRTKAPQSVLDVGTGTGVLARIARAHGASFVVATDIDPVALAAAGVNVALDHHPTEILITDAMPDTWGPRFDLVVANILEGPLKILAPNLLGALAPGATLLLSGFTPLQTPAMRVAFGPMSESILDGWSLLMLRRPTLLELREKKAARKGT